MTAKLTSLQKLEKRLQQLQTFKRKGGSFRQKHGRILVAEYNLLIIDVQDSGEWRDYCEKNDLAVGHSGYDLLD